MITINDWVNNDYVYGWVDGRLKAVYTDNRISIDKNKQCFEVFLPYYSFTNEDLFVKREDCIKNQIELLNKMLERTED